MVTLASALCLVLATTGAEARAAPVERAAPTELGFPRVGGYMQPAVSWTQEAGAAAFSIRKARIRLSGRVEPIVLSYALLFELAGGGVPIRDAYVELGRFVGQTLRVGQFKVPFGWEQRVSDGELPTIDRSMVAERLAVGADPRDVGVCVFGDVPLGGELRLEDAVAVVNGAGPNRLEPMPSRSGFGRVGLRWRESVRAGVSAALVDLPPEPQRERSIRLGVDLTVDTGRLLLAIEGIRALVSRPIPAARSGGALLLGGRFFERWELWGRIEQFSPEDARPDRAINRATVGLNHHLQPGRIKLMANLQREFGAGRASGAVLQLHLQI